MIPGDWREDPGAVAAAQAEPRGLPGLVRASAGPSGVREAVWSVFCPAQGDCPCRTLREASVCGRTVGPLPQPGQQSLFEI